MTIAVTTSDDVQHVAGEVDLAHLAQTLGQPSKAALLRHNRSTPTVSPPAPHAGGIVPIFSVKGLFAS